MGFFTLQLKNIMISYILYIIDLSVFEIIRLRHAPTCFYWLHHASFYNIHNIAL